MPLSLRRESGVFFACIKSSIKSFGGIKMLRVIDGARSEAVSKVVIRSCWKIGTKIFNEMLLYFRSRRAKTIDKVYVEATRSQFKISEIQNKPLKRLLQDFKQSQNISTKVEFLTKLIQDNMESQACYLLDKGINCEDGVFREPEAQRERAIAVAIKDGVFRHEVAQRTIAEAIKEGVFTDELAQIPIAEAIKEGRFTDEVAQKTIAKAIKECRFTDPLAQIIIGVAINEDKFTDPVAQRTIAVAIVEDKFTAPMAQITIALAINKGKFTDPEAKKILIKSQLVHHCGNCGLEAANSSEFKHALGDDEGGGFIHFGRKFYLGEELIKQKSDIKELLNNSTGKFDDYFECIFDESNQ